MRESLLDRVERSPVVDGLPERLSPPPASDTLISALEEVEVDGQDEREATLLLLGSADALDDSVADIELDVVIEDTPDCDLESHVVKLIVGDVEPDVDSEDSIDREGRVDIETEVQAVPTDVEETVFVIEINPVAVA